MGISGLVELEAMHLIPHVRFPKKTVFLELEKADRYRKGTGMANVNLLSHSLEVVASLVSL